MLRKDRRRDRRVEIDIEAELRPVEFHPKRSLSGPPIRAKVSNIGPAGVMIDLLTEEPLGSRFRVSLDLDGSAVEFFAIVRHVTIVVTGTQPVYAHGLQITAAAEEVIEAIENYYDSRMKPSSYSAKAPLRTSNRPPTAGMDIGAFPGPVLGPVSD